MAEVMESIGGRVRRLRIERGMERRDLAGKAGLNASHIWRIEEGDYNPTDRTIRRIAFGLDVEPSVLMGGTPTLPNDEEFLLSLYRRIPDAKRRDVFTYLAPLAAGRDFDLAMSLTVPA